MMTQLRDFFAYNVWRNAKILANAAKIQDWQFDAPTTFPMGSLRGTLAHVIGVDELWYQRLHEGVSPKSILSKDDIPTLAAAAARWQVIQQKWQHWLSELSDADLEKPKSYMLLGGGQANDPLWGCLLHVVNHGTQHGGELAQMLTEYGRSPGNIDYLYFMREK